MPLIDAATIPTAGNSVLKVLTQWNAHNLNGWKVWHLDQRLNIDNKGAGAKRKMRGRYVRN